MDTNSPPILHFQPIAWSSDFFERRDEADLLTGAAEVVRSGKDRVPWVRSKRQPATVLSSVEEKSSTAAKIALGIVLPSQFRIVFE
jgi:hypothetical protein